MNADKQNLFRLYIDESGDHVFRKTDLAGHRYLGLVGCSFKNADYLIFHAQLVEFKARHFGSHPDSPVVLHRSDIINRKGAFGRLREKATNENFERDLLDLIDTAKFLIVAVVLDKKKYQESYSQPYHPYHYGLTLMLERYCGYLNHLGFRGDVLAESRGRVEDNLLANAYQHNYIHGSRFRKADFFQKALTSKNIKLERKNANISGLEFADLLAYPVTQGILLERGLIEDPGMVFGRRIAEKLLVKYNRHIYKGIIDGYGKIFVP
jgi:hypothetical protein